MSDRTRRNVVLVSIDSLRADYCGYVSSDRDATPTLTGMADDGIAFSRAIAPGPSTPESMPATFTGEYPVDRGSSDAPELATYRERIRRHMLARETLPERFSRLGYTTGAFTPNPFTSRHFGFDQGFDRFQDFMGETRGGSGLYDRVFEGFLKGGAASSLVRVLLNFWGREEVFKPWESYYDDVVEWADAAAEPYFLWVFLMDAHNPYLASSEYRSQSRLEQFHANVRFWRESHETPFSATVHDRLVTAYEDAVGYADAFLDRLRSDLDGDPLFVVHGDHGEAFGEHGTYGHEPYLHPENVHVPLVVGGAPARTVDDPVSLRALPGILTSVATEPSPDLGRSAYALTRTLQGDDSAVYTRDTQYSRRGTVEPGASAETEPLRRIVDRFSASQREQRTIANAAERVTDV
jgi:arylsulfatase